ncbi:MAG: GNAT family N-acetyltransferase [Gammaproteobacteria bacterium]|nr:GNAT family N-acetyltransferase [Gammaproteobacteria bacterium]MDH5778604.1 GNAT family N-acetyltransferase [Gammaproteobacteria bacterium]
MAYLIPEIIETERLNLRMFQAEDWRDLCVLYSDAETTQYTLRRTLDEDETWRIVVMFIGHWQVRGYGPYAVEDKATGKVMGNIGLWYPEIWPEPEIMWSLAKPFWGKGFASEAAFAVKKMAVEKLPDVSLISLMDKNNIRSQGVAKKLGARFEKEIIFKNHPTCVYRHT